MNDSDDIQGVDFDFGVRGSRRAVFQGAIEIDCWPVGGEGWRYTLVRRPDRIGLKAEFRFASFDGCANAAINAARLLLHPLAKGKG